MLVKMRDLDVTTADIEWQNGFSKAIRHIGMT